MTSSAGPKLPAAVASPGGAGFAGGWGGGSRRGGGGGRRVGGGRRGARRLEPLAELDHVRLRPSRAPPDGDAVGRARHGDGEERRGEQPADARNGRRANRRWTRHATATNRGATRGRTRAPAAACWREAAPDCKLAPTSVSDLLDSLREALADRYAVERELGRGGMATVFLAEDLKHHRSVAIKVLHAEVTAALGAERVPRQIAIAAPLQHPHILPLYDSGAATGFLYYVMPYVEGESLRDRLQREKQLSLEDAVKITTEVASALAYAHSHGVVHRDIKPENIMLSGGTAVVTDFGIARAVSAAGQGRHLTETGTILGTPAYMSPEQSTGSYEIDGRSDQYSLACVVYEMLVGEPPFTGPTAQAIIARHSLDSVSPPSIVRAMIPESAERAILRALAKVPADRFATTALFAEALAAPGAPVGARRTTRATAAPRWGGLPRGVVLAGVAVVVAIAGWEVFGRGRARSSGAAAGGLDPRHVAVLYFEDLSPKHDLAYLADGLTETLIADLQRARLH